MRLYAYISLHRKRWTVQQLCRVLKVSESGYYRSLKPALRKVRQHALLVKIKEILSRFPENENFRVGGFIWLCASKEKISVIPQCIGR